MDKIDLNILASLQANGRLPNVELARMNDLAASTTLERMRRLEDQGVIKGYRAIVDPQALGFRVQALVLINLDRHQMGSIDDFEARVRAVPEVMSCVHVTGRYDYVLHAVVRNMDHLGELVKHRIAAISGVEKQETFLVLSTVKENKGYPITAAPQDADRSSQEA
jgi:Lrp/AsnC family leucine-responsive transcriptional regulator